MSMPWGMQSWFLALGTTWDKPPGRSSFFGNFKELEGYTGRAQDLRFKHEIILEPWWGRNRQGLAGPEICLSGILFYYDE